MRRFVRYDRCDRFDGYQEPTIAHRGYDPARIVGTLYMTLEGIFGVPLDVAATYIALFTIFGAVLNVSGTGKFLVDWSLAAVGRSRHGAGAGRAVTAAGLLLGTVSGSGVATTVTLGSTTWPVLKRAGYPAAMAGAILSAAGIGAIISPPALGAAAFIIAELLKISYLQVIVMATIPSLLYFLAIFLMIEADTRRLGTRPVELALPSAVGADPAAGLPLSRASPAWRSCWRSGCRRSARCSTRSSSPSRLSFVDPADRALAAPPGAGDVGGRKERHRRGRRPRPPRASSSASSR